ncbi:hypothetical protein OH77DRAFT_1433284 [Trametes cingulata]|nr:hypothetical protein OH77DRAFT_1433284 [Trametes cingulata]
MFPALAPMLTTPLLKIPILVPDAILTYISLTPPNPPPAAHEQQKYSRTDWFTKNHLLQTKVVDVCKWALIGLMAAETATILAQEFPSPLSSRLLSLLVPSPLARPLPLAPTPRFLLTGALVVAAGLVRAWTYRTLGKYFRWQLSVLDDHCRLVTSGPYAWVRHPSYVASALVSYGNLVLLCGRGTYWTEVGLGRTVAGKVAAGAVAAYLLFLHAYLISGRVEREDEVLRAQFGEEWEAWARRTPYKLIPYIY